MLFRLRASMRWPVGHWGPVWCRDQMAVRFGQAVHIRHGLAGEEAPVNLVDGATFTCDLPLQDEGHALDALATLSASTVLGQTIPLDDGVGSWVEVHRCDHNDEVRAGCVVVGREEGPS